LVCTHQTPPRYVFQRNKLQVFSIVQIHLTSRSLSHPLHFAVISSKLTHRLYL